MNYFQRTTMADDAGRAPLLLMGKQDAPTNLQPNLLGSFPADVCPNILPACFFGKRAKFGSSVVEVGRVVR